VIPARGPEICAVRSGLKKHPGGAALAVFNLTGAERSDYVEATVDFDARPTMLLDFNRTDEAGRYPHHYVDNSAEALRELPTGVKVFDGGRELPAALIGAEVANHMDLDYRRFPRQYNVNRCRIGFVARDVPPMGYKTLRVEAVYGGDKPAAQDSPPRIENEFFLVEPDPDTGALTVTDKESGRALRGLNLLSDGGNCGDEYTYCPPDKDRIVFPAPETLTARVAERSAARQVLEIRGVMRIPEGLYNRSEARSAEVADCPFVARAAVYPGVRRIDMRTTFENRARWHRLRALFPAGVRAEAHWSASAFAVDRRPMFPEADPNAREICRTHPQKDFCALDDGKNGLTVANRGLSEYEAYDNGETSVLAVTLLRCTGVISQRVLATRDEAAGWHEAAPGAQCAGSWDFEYSVIPHKGDWVESRAYQEAHAFNLPMPSMQLDAGTVGDLPNRCESVRLNHPALQISAFKQCEFEDALILRFYNATPEAVDAEIRFSFPFESVRRANLREDTIGAVRLRGRTACMPVGPFEIVTLKILP
jgi:alpha-mannosidase